MNNEIQIPKKLAITLRILTIILHVITLLGGSFVLMMSATLTDSPKNAEFMGPYLLVYWPVAFGLFIGSLCVTVSMLKRRTLLAFMLSLASFVLCATPLVGFLGYALLELIKIIK